MSTYTAFIILPIESGDPLLSDELATTVRIFLSDRGFTCTTRWFYDEFAADGTEYGARIDVTGSDRFQWGTLLTSIEALASARYGNVRVEG